MTDVELVRALIAHIPGGCMIVCDQDRYIEVVSDTCREPICFEFDQNGNITSLYH